MSGPPGRRGEAPATDNTLSPRRTGDRSCTGRLGCPGLTVAERFPPFGPAALDSSAVFTPSPPNINAGEMVKNPACVQNGLHRGNSKGRARFYAGRALCLPRRSPGVARMACALGPGRTAPQFRARSRSAARLHGAPFVPRAPSPTFSPGAGWVAAGLGERSSPPAAQAGRPCRANDSAHQRGRQPRAEPGSHQAAAPPSPREPGSDLQREAIAREPVLGLETRTR